ncbi:MULTISPECIES: hypothetical protein [unclassified Micromonospora]|uniref:hypothetical protein n=1 Tax=unclassified Micromonospora TaxID=2617518 RepID=UPI002FEFF819
MNDVSEFPIVRYFAQANPVGPGQDDVPALLRRVADTIEQLGPVWIQDMTFENEINEHGDWYSLTVYFQEESTAGE